MRCAAFSECCPRIEDHVGILLGRVPQTIAQRWRQLQAAQHLHPVPHLLKRPPAALSQAIGGRALTLRSEAGEGEHQARIHSVRTSGDALAASVTERCPATGLGGAALFREEIEDALDEAGRIGCIDATRLDGGANLDATSAASARIEDPFGAMLETCNELFAAGAHVE